MEKEEIKLIGKFMGYNVIIYKGHETFDSNPSYRTIGETKFLWHGMYLMFTGRYVKDVSYPFNQSWDYLIPIIDRINRTGIDCRIINDLHAAILSVNIKDAYKETINFIRWYNQKTNTNQK